MEKDRNYRKRSFWAFIHCHPGEEKEGERKKERERKREKEEGGRSFSY